MNYSCPGCKGSLSIDLGSVNTFSLRIKCPHCQKGLLLNDSTKSFVDNDKESKLQSIKTMVELSMADGSIDEKERSVLIRQSKEYGIEESALEALIEKHKVENVSNIAPVLEEEYSEKLSEYKNDSDTYDHYRFMQVIASLTPNNPNLIKYRADLLQMLSHNADRFKELVRKWEEIYDASTSSSDWDEILEHKNGCNASAKALRGLRETIESKNRKEFLEFIKVVTTPDKDAW